MKRLPSFGIILGVNAFAFGTGLLLLVPVLPRMQDVRFIVFAAIGFFAMLAGYAALILVAIESIHEEDAEATASNEKTLTFDS